MEEAFSRKPPQNWRLFNTKIWKFPCFLGLDWRAARYDWCQSYNGSICKNRLAVWADVSKNLWERRRILIKLSKLRNKAAKASTVSSSFSLIKVGTVSDQRQHYHSSPFDHIKTGHEWEREAPSSYPGPAGGPPINPPWTLLFLRSSLSINVLISRSWEKKATRELVG